MDPAQKSSDDAVQSSVTPPAPSSQQQQPAATPPITPVGAPSKEHAPIVHHSEHLQHLHPAPHEATPAVSEEVAKHVEVSPNPEQPSIPQSVRQMGVQEAKESVPAPTTLSNAPQFQYTPEQVAQEKKYPVLDSIRWRLVLFGRQIKKAHLQLLRGKK